MAKLGKHVNIKTGKLDANAAVAGGQYPFFTCARDTLVIDNYAFEADAILVAGNGDLNVKHYNGRFNAYQRTYVITVINTQELDTRYLFHWMSKYIDRLRELSIGGAIKYIKLGMLTNAEMPLPALEEQKRIATILDKADAIRRKRQQTIDPTEQLLRSVFLDMFGDPVGNPKMWPIQELAKLVQGKDGLVDGPFGSAINTKVDYIPDGEIPIIRTKNVGRFEFKYDDLKFISREKYSTIMRSRVVPGDIVLTKVGTIGSVCEFPSLYPEAVLSTTGSSRIRFKPDYILKNYGLFYLEMYKPEMHRIASTGVQPFLNLSHIKSFKVPMPPIELQNTFSDFMNLIYKSRTLLTKTYDVNETLISALMQQAFSGESTKQTEAA